MSLRDEIHEQPDVISRVLGQNRDEAKAVRGMMASTTHGLIAARGTSDNAARYAQYVWGARNNYTVGLTTPSLFSVYEDPPRIRDATVIGISQSGQSPDIVAVLEEAARQGQPTVAISNDPGSPLANAAEVVLDLRAGPERAVAATKTYTSELANIALVSTGGETPELELLPEAIESALALEQTIADAAMAMSEMEQCAVIARGFNHATAFEWALKLQELTYAVAQPFSSADFLHGPVAVLEPGYPVLAVATKGPTLEDVTDVIERCIASGARVLTITDDERVAGLNGRSILLETGLPEWLTPIPAIACAQLFTLHLTLAKGLDVEAPRGLSKVTRTL